MVASETITNYTRMPQRRVEQTIGLTYDATPDQVQTIAEESISGWLTIKSSNLPT